MREKKWKEYKRKNSSAISKTTTETGKRYDTLLPLKKRIEICDNALSNEFDILIRNSQLIIYHHPLRDFYMDDWSGNLIETLINKICNKNWNDLYTCGNMTDI